MTPLEMMGLLVAAHALCDYPLQGDFLAKTKNRFAPIPGVPWYQALLAHSVIHGAAVALVTGSWVLGVLETIFHATIDDAKCAGKITYNDDQILHLICKAVWVWIALTMTRT